MLAGHMVLWPGKMQPEWLMLGLGIELGTLDLGSFWILIMGG